jgi:LmbE family N-acetylglucosaminyl deacetylase
MLGVFGRPLHGLIQHLLVSGPSTKVLGYYQSSCFAGLTVRPHNMTADKSILISRQRVIIYLLIFLLTGLALPIPAQKAVGQTTAAVDKPELHQALLDLTNTATVMCIAAHPDDEDGTTLTVLRRKYGVHTVSLFSTYGEGGQNAVGPELYEELGVIRAKETNDAAQIQGSEPYFLGLKDFGFSKSADEAFRVWGHEEALRRMVLKIRELRPDVIITNHDTTTGHGHHQATGRLALEAFDAAGDPKRFPEQLASVSVWQPKRLFVRARSQTGSNTVATPAAEERIVSVDPNEMDPIRGTIYAAQALAALQKHASQGPWPASIADRLRGNASGKLPLIRYRLAREAVGSEALPAEAKTFLDGLPVALRSAPTVDGRALTEISDQPTRVLNALIAWRRRAGNSPTVEGDPQRARLMTARTNHALAVASGVTANVSSQNEVLVPGTTASFTINIANAGDRTIQIKKLTFAGFGERVELEAAEQLGADTDTSNVVEHATPRRAPFSVPQSEHLYDGRLNGEHFQAEAELEVDGAKFLVAADRDVNVGPAVEIRSISPRPYVWTPNTANRPLQLKLTLVNNLPSAFKGVVKLRGLGTQSFEVGRAIVLEPHERREVTLESNALPGVPPARQRRRSANTDLTLSVLNNEAAVVTDRKVGLVASDARVSPVLKVGYLPSFDTTLEQSLAALGVSATKLTVENVQGDELRGYDTIIIDNRGYYAHPELIGANRRLFDFAEQGGTLVVFYHKDNEWNPNDRGRPQLAPYSIILSDERVTEEVAPIRFLQPRHPLLNYPNKIRSSDFNNWIQERGLYYPKEWDSHYTALFASNDQGEKPLQGGLLVARYGKGAYIYTSMVWYRQLMAGVPGAYRMLANMISYGH